MNLRIRISLNLALNSPAHPSVSQIDTSPPAYILPRSTRGEVFDELQGGRHSHSAPKRAGVRHTLLFMQADVSITEIDYACC